MAPRTRPARRTHRPSRVVWAVMATAPLYLVAGAVLFAALQMPGEDEFTALKLPPLPAQVEAAPFEPALLPAGTASALKAAALVGVKPVVPVVKSMAGPAELDAWILQASVRHEIPVALIRAVIQVESNFNPRAVSPVGAMGLMQLMPGTARDMRVSDPFDPRQNIEGGTRYLRVLANQFDGDLVKVVAAYNAGPEAVRRQGGRVPPFAETRAYVRRVLELSARPAVAVATR